MEQVTVGLVDDFNLIYKETGFHHEDITFKKKNETGTDFRRSKRLHTLMKQSLKCIRRKALNVNYYENTWPHVDSIVVASVHKATMNDEIVSAALLRMHSHDCLIRVLDKGMQLFASPQIQIIFIWSK